MSKKICVFGDSIANGSCDSIGGGWVNRLKTFFLASDYDHSVYNLGVSGDNSDNLLARFEIECIAREPEIIVIAIGINDAQHNIKTGKTRVSLEGFKNNINKLINIAEKFTNKIILVEVTKVEELKVTPIPWDENKEKCYLNDNIKKYNSIIENICSEQSLRLIKVFNLLDNIDLDDGLHPNEKGHEAIFEKVKKELIKAGVIE